MADLKFESVFSSEDIETKQSDYVVTYITHSLGGAVQFAAMAEKQSKRKNSRRLVRVKCLCQTIRV